MERTDAVAIFDRLEARTELYEGEEYAGLNVRLDATTDNNGQRTYRVRITAPASDYFDGAALEEISGTVQQQLGDEATIQIQNNGIELS